MQAQASAVSFTEAAPGNCSTGGRAHACGKSALRQRSPPDAELLNTRINLPHVGAVVVDVDVDVTALLVVLAVDDVWAELVVVAGVLVLLEPGVLDEAGVLLALVLAGVDVAEEDVDVAEDVDVEVVDDGSSSCSTVFGLTKIAAVLPDTTRSPYRASSRGTIASSWSICVRIAKSGPAWKRSPFEAPTPAAARLATTSEMVGAGKSSGK